MSVVTDMVTQMVGKKWYATGPDLGQCTAVPHELQERLGLGYVYGNAIDTYDNAPDSIYIKALNSPSFVPAEGAIGVSRVAPYGHTWVCLADCNTNTQNVLEQNNPLGNPVRTASNNYEGSTPAYGYFLPRALAAVPAQPTPTPVDAPRADNDGVVNGQGLHGHTDPNTTSSWPWFFDDNEHVTILARTQGENVISGPYASSSWWYLVQGVGSPKVWVPDAYLRTTRTPANVPDWTPTTATPDPTPVNQYSPRPVTGILGVDVSSVGQGKIDWDTLVGGDGNHATEGAGIDFAVARAGNVGPSHGGVANEADPQFAFNRSEAQRLKVPFGAYWFAYPDLDPKVEAGNFAAVIGNVADSESLWLDVETDPTEGADLVEWCRAFKIEIERLTNRVCRGYYNVSFHDRYPGLEAIFGSQGVWAAKFDNDPAGRPFNSAIMHQYSDAGVLPGISGKIDLNVFWGTLDQFVALGSKASSMQTPPPTGTPGVDHTLSDKIDAQTGLLNQILALIQHVLEILTKVFK